MLLGLIGSLLHASTWLLVTSDRVAISHHHDVLVLMVVGAPNEQLSKAPLDGTVSVRALADIIDGVDAVLQLLAFGRQVTQLLYENDVVTVVQRSGVPRQGAVTSVAHVLEFIYEEIGECFDLANIEVGMFLSEGDTLRCIQYKEKVNRTIRKLVSLVLRLRPSQENAQQREETSESLHG